MNFKKINYKSNINYIYISSIKSIVSANYLEFKGLSFFSIFLKRKLNYVNYRIRGKSYSRSFGQLLKVSRKIKYYKKSIKNISMSINILNRRLRKFIKNIFLFYCKNYCLKNYMWIKKFNLLINPNIVYFITSNSWNYIKKKKNV